MEKKRMAILLAAVFVLTAAIVVVLPYAVHRVRYDFPDLRIWDTFSYSSILNYYGNAVSFLGAAAAGLTAIYLALRNQEKSNEIRMLEQKLKEKEQQEKE